LGAQLTGLEYGYVMQKGRDCIQLEKKSDMKKRGLASPDKADALCLVAGTMIKTTKGDVPIERLLVGDEVLTPFGKSKVSILWKSETLFLTTVEFSNGAALRGKGAHKIFTWGSGQTRLDALPLTIEVEPFGRRRRLLWLSASFLCTEVRNIGFKHAVDIIARANRLTASAFFIGAFGLTIMALSRKVFIYITKITTGATALSTILNFRMELSIAGIIGNCGWPTIKKETNKISTRQEWLRQNGTDQARGWSGTENMALRHGKTENPLDRFVRFARRPIGLFSRTALDSAVCLAKERPITKNPKTMFAPVVGAARRFLRIVTGTQAVVPASVQTENVLPTKVYNLTLERDNAYYANGILVYNCLTFAYPVMPSDHTMSLTKKSNQHTIDYNPLSIEAARGG
jgi:hypothetical protein